MQRTTTVPPNPPTPSRNRWRFAPLICSAMVCGFAAVSDAQEVAKKVDKGTPDAIAWFASWKQGLASAEQTNRPILLIAAAPHCHNISGMW